MCLFPFVIESFVGLLACFLLVWAPISRQINYQFYSETDKTQEREEGKIVF